MVVPLPHPRPEDASDVRAGGFLAGARLWAVRLLSLFALLAAGYLSWISLAGGADSALGCGGLPQFDCQHVLSSRWARWLGVPVSLGAVAVYGAMFAAVFVPTRSSRPRLPQLCAALLVLCATIAAGAALWFLGLLAFATEKLCLWCLLTHTCGLLCAALVLPGALLGRAKPRPWSVPRAGVFAAGGVLVVGVLIAGQVLFPPAGYRISEVADAGQQQPAAHHRPHREPETAGPQDGGSAHSPATTGPNSTTAGRVPDNPAAAAQQAGASDTAGDSSASGASGAGELVPEPPTRSVIRRVQIFGGQVVLDPREWPVLGDPRAEYWVVNLSDYTCRHCRKLHGYLQQARSHFGDRLGVIFLPVPMNTRCNKFVEYTHEDHRLACEYARLALAVWRADATQFETFHNWLYEPERPPPLPQARQYAARLVGQEALQAQLNDRALAEMLRQNTLLYYRAGRGTVPKLLFGRYVVTGETRSAEELIGLLESRLGIRP